VTEVFTAPLWIVALAIAAAAPFCVSGWQAVLESQLRRRTELVLERARRSMHAAASPGTEAEARGNG
jgi:hypothetical protein